MLKEYMYKVHSLIEDKGIKYVAEHAIDKLLSSIFTPIYIKIENNVFHDISISLSGTPVAYEMTGSFDGHFLVGTGSGVLFLNKFGVYRLFGGHTYGITRNDNIYIVQQNMHNYSRIISFELIVDNSMADYHSLKVVSLLNTRSIHQIDYFKNQIYVCDTNKNRLLILDYANKTTKAIYPDGKLKNGRSSSNYHHFNSVFVTENMIYLLAHNETTKTGKNSEIYCLDRTNYSIVNIIKTSGSNAHNIIIYRNKFMYCDSMNGSVIYDDKVFFQDRHYFTRGISITDPYIVVGGSEFAKREDRSSKDGIIYFLDKQGKCISSVKLKGIGPLQEIRHIGEDYALSESNSIT